MTTPPRPASAPALPAGLIADLIAVFDTHRMPLREALGLLPELGVPLKQALDERRQVWLASQGLIDGPTLVARLGLDERQFRAAQHLGLLLPTPWPSDLLLPGERDVTATGFYCPDLALSDVQRQLIRAVTLLGREAAAEELGITPTQFDRLRREANLLATVVGTYRLSDIDALHGAAAALPPPKSDRGLTPGERWNALNARQQAYLRAVFRLDQEQEASERGKYARGEWARPAAEWRPQDYGVLPGWPPTPSPLYAAIEQLGMRDSGTGSTFQALEHRGLVICRHDLPGRAALCVEITTLGRRVVRAATGAPSGSGKLLPDWAWRWVADMYAAGAEGLPARIGETTRLYLFNLGFVLEQGRLQLTEVGQEYYEINWPVYVEHYPEIEAPLPVALQRGFASGEPPEHDGGRGK